GELIAELYHETHEAGKKIRKVPHVLSMSATPIPRSLALTSFGDIEGSLLESKPEGRKKVITKVIDEPSLQEKMYDWIEHEIRERGEQAYVVCPLIQESEKSDVASAVKEFERLQQRYPR